MSEEPLTCHFCKDQVEVETYEIMQNGKIRCESCYYEDWAQRLEAKANKYVD